MMTKARALRRNFDQQWPYAMNANDTAQARSYSPANAVLSTSAYIRYAHPRTRTYLAAAATIGMHVQLTKLR